MASKSDKKAKTADDKKSDVKKSVKKSDVAKPDSKKSVAKSADKKSAKKAEKKADLKAEAKFLKKSLEADTLKAEKAAAKAKKELKKERELVKEQLQKAKERAEKIAKKDAQRADKKPKTAVAGTASVRGAAPITPRTPAARVTARGARTGSSAVRSSTEPSESWTMVALRSHAGSTGVTGYSRLNKADLLAKLRGTDTLD